MIDIDDMARKFLTEMAAETPLRYHAGAWWEHCGTHYGEVPDQELDGMIRLWLASKQERISSSLVTNLTAQARAHVALERGLEMPCWLGEEHDRPDRDGAVAFRNGLLDIRRFLAGEDGLMPHTPQWFSASCLPYDFDANATCPLWQQTLRQWLGDDEQVRLLRQWFGYCVTEDIDQQKFMFLVGPTRSGKSTTLNMLTHLLGPRNVAAVSQQSLSGDFGLEKLVGKQAALISEVHVGRDVKNFITVLKAITGGDLVSVNRKGRVETEHRLRCRFTIAANQLPRLPDDSNALPARMLLLEYPHSFLGREDIDLERKLLAELPGVAVWALEGLRDLRACGRFVRPAAGQDLIDEFTHLAAPIDEFLEDCCVEGADLWEPTDYLYLAWKLWCHEGGYEAGARNTFGSKLHAARVGVRLVQKRVGGTGRLRGYQGIELSNEGLKSIRESWGGSDITSERVKIKKTLRGPEVTGLHMPPARVGGQEEVAA